MSIGVVSLMWEVLEDAFRDLLELASGFALVGYIRALA